MVDGLFALKGGLEDAVAERSLTTSVSTASTPELKRTFNFTHVTNCHFYFVLMELCHIFVVFHVLDRKQFHEN